MTPTVNSPDVSGVYALLAVLADPNAYAARLDELVSKTAAFERTVEDLRAKQKALDAHNDSAEKMRAEAYAARDEAKRIAAEGAMQVKAGVAANEGRAAELNAAERTLASKQAEFDKRSREWAAEQASLEAALETANAEASRLHAEAAADAKAAAELKAEYETKIAALKAAVQ